ncbi:uridylate kinase [Plantactinospora sp. BB1]|uniref:uridylate kinase n=1 Tax=Plantactinospora sp. BB1 TaxID=2071627 RepID=UPI0018FEDBB2|nr:uridylate kinase [Plantactinospora sp. BB1]
MTESEFLTRVVELIRPMRPGHPLRVAVDGPDAAGKSSLAAELARRLAPVRETITASVDGFHRPRAVRQRRGGLSAEGYYRDSFDYPALRAALLDPLGPGGSRRYRTVVFDHRTDQVVDLPPEQATDDAVLLFDGVFLLRPELREQWDLSIYLAVSPAESLRRALVRDLELFGSAESVRERYEARYLPGQQLYRAEADPAGRADVLVDYDDPARPRVLRWPAARALR